MDRFLLLTGALLGFVGVGLGAFAAHGLREAVSAQDLETFKTAAHYQLIHSLAVVLCGLLLRVSPSAWTARSGIAFIGGTLIFSGSLYLLVLTQTRWLGAITPIGGVLFLVGWALLALSAWRS